MFKTIRSLFSRMFTATVAAAALPSPPIASLSEPDLPSGVFMPTPRAGKYNAARAAAFRARVNRRKPGRYRLTEG